MAYSAPATRSTGDLITAAIWNQDISANEIALKALIDTNTTNISSNDTDITALNTRVDLPMNRNKIINGSFNIWQRGTSFAAAASGTFSADRWGYYKSGDMIHTLTQSTDVPSLASPGGNIAKYSLKVDCTTVDSSIGATDYCILRHVVEGYNWLSLLYGGNALTLSFWVKATKTGTYTVGLRNSGVDRAFIAEYTVSVSGEWEFKEIAISAPPAAGTWNYTNGVGVYVEWSLAAGANFQGSTGSWISSGTNSTSNQVNACDSTSNDFFLTLVQLEAGSNSTNFEMPLYSDELARCLRYYVYNPDMVIGILHSSTEVRALAPLPTTMRTAPTITWGEYEPGGTALAFSNNGTSKTFSAASSITLEPDGISFLATGGTSVSADAAWCISPLYFDAEL